MRRLLLVLSQPSFPYPNLDLAHPDTLLNLGELALQSNKGSLAFRQPFGKTFEILVNNRRQVDHTDSDTGTLTR